MPHYSSITYYDSHTPHTHSLSLHDALPIWKAATSGSGWMVPAAAAIRTRPHRRATCWRTRNTASSRLRASPRSEEHTSELQSRRDLVCRLLLEKKKYKIINHILI